MTNKRPFKFDFDEDADPVEELHRLRVATARHFKTPEAISEYYRSTPSVDELIAELDREIAENKAKAEANAARSRKAETGKAVKKAAPARRRKAAKRLTPA